MKSTNVKPKYKIGTRGSLLAVTQCTLISDEISKLTNSNFQLIKIKTQGDQITDRPLWQLEGKDFFTKELDTALLNNDVDLVVHSYKDLGSDRPIGIKIGAITQRNYPHDVLLIKKDKFKNLNSTKTFIVGTSSPRRIVNIQKSLGDYLQIENKKIECKTLRGNINTRIEKLIDDQYDAIVLAFAGLERLASYPSSAVILKDLLSTLDFMILPTKDFPPASSQGALAIEYNESNEKTILPVLRSVHSKSTEEEIKRERATFSKYGGGCHLAVGINVKKVGAFYIHNEKGEVDNSPVEKMSLEGFDYPNLSGLKPYFMFSQYDYLTNYTSLQTEINPKMNTYITSSHCFDAINGSENSLWTAGNRTMKKLLQNGYWVCGSTEGFGENEIVNFSQSNFVNLAIGNAPWVTLTHDNGTSNFSKVIGVYEHKINDEIDLVREKELLNADIIYWSSKIQFELYTKKYPELLKKKHATGLGKTYSALEAYAPIPCIDMNHLKQLIKG